MYKVYQYKDSIIGATLINTHVPSVSRTLPPSTFMGGEGLALIVQ